MGEHKGSTDAAHKVQLPSAIQRCRWGAAACPAGNMVPLEVITLFVGDGSDVKAEVRTKSGKTVGKVEGKVSISRFAATFKIPDKTSEDIYFEAQLSKHGLSARSDLLRVLPMVQISNARWDKKEVRRGETVKLSADVKGPPDGTEVQVSILEHDQDGAHDVVAEFPASIKGSKLQAEWRFDYVDDTDDIPSKEESPRGYKNPEFLFRVSSGGAHADSGLLSFKDAAHVVLTDEEGNPIPKAKYVVKLPDGSEKKGTLDEDGRAPLKDVPPGKFHVEFPDL